MRSVVFAACVLLVARTASAEDVRFGPFLVHQWLHGEGIKAEKIGAACPAPISTSRTLAEWTPGRWNSANEIFVLVLQSRPRPCAVPAFVDKTRGILEGGLGGATAAVRLGVAPLSAEQAESLLSGRLLGSTGWPVERSESEMAAPNVAELASLRPALFCRPSKTGWPRMNKNKKTKPPFDAVAELEPSNVCELWLVPVANDGAPKVGGASYLIRAGLALNDVELPAAWGKAAGAALEVSLPFETLSALRRGGAPAAPVVLDAGVAADAGVAPVTEDAGAREELACTPACLPTCTKEQLDSPAMQDVRGRVEQHLRAQELSTEWPKGQVPVLKGAPTPRDCAAFELLIFTLSRHLSCQVPIARCAGAGG